jgi:hypothetical protein
MGTFFRAIFSYDLAKFQSISMKNLKALGFWVNEIRSFRTPHGENSYFLKIAQSA